MNDMLARLVFLLLACIPVCNATAQRQTTSDLLTLYLEERALELAIRDIRQRGGRIEPMEVADVPPEDDRVRRWLEALYPDTPRPSDDPPLFELTSVEPIKRIRRPGREAMFHDTAWAFAGSQSRSPLDTLMTRDIRARMQAQFGSPSRLVVDMDSVEALPAAEVIQFEYWFVLNDSIPVMVVDVNGPWDRGIVVAVPASLRHSIREVKRALLWDVGRSPRRAPWADYYYNSVQGTWYITGYDGAMFFDRRIGRPDVDLGPPSMVPFLNNR